MSDNKDFSVGMSNWAEYILEQANQLDDSKNESSTNKTTESVENFNSELEEMTFDEYYELFDFHESAMDQMKLAKISLEQGTDFKENNLLTYLTYRFFISEFGTTGSHSKNYEFLVKNIEKRISRYEKYNSKYKEFKNSRQHYEYNYINYLADAFCYLFEEWYENPNQLLAMGYTLKDLTDDLDYLINEKHVYLSDTQKIDSCLGMYFKENSNFEWRQFDEEVDLYWLNNLLQLITFCQQNHKSITLGGAEFNKTKEYDISRDITAIISLINYRLHIVDKYGLGG